MNLLCLIIGVGIGAALCAAHAAALALLRRPRKMARDLNGVAQRNRNAQEPADLLSRLRRVGGL